MKTENMALRLAAQSITNYVEKKQMPRWAEWGILVSSLVRHFKKNRAITETEQALKAIADACRNGACIGQVEAMTLMTAVQVAWREERREYLNGASQHEVNHTNQARREA